MPTVGSGMADLLKRFTHSEDGGMIALTAVSMVGVLSVLALCIDLAGLYTARAEAQKAADASALAGAQEFLKHTNPANAVTPATQKAVEFAGYNVIRGSGIDTSEVQVQVDAGSRQVYSLVRRQNVPLWFARLFGVSQASIAASATAHASPANTASCIAPIAIPDWWDDVNDDTNFNNLPDGNESWKYEPHLGDRYERWNWYPETGSETGLGSTFRSGGRDYGSQMIIKPQVPAGPNNPIDLEPSNYHMLDLPGAPGKKGWSNNMIAAAQGTCPWGPTTLGVGIPLEPGVGAGPTWQTFQQIYDMDDTAFWHPTNNEVWGPNGPNPNSPRILTFVVFSPDQIANIQAKQPVVPNNFARFFVENRPSGPHDHVMGRFMTYVSGFSQGGGPPGSLILHVQLIK